MTINTLPDIIKKYLSSHIDDIVKLAIDYINLNMKDLSEDDVNELSSYNDNFTFALDLKEKPYKLVFRKKIPSIIDIWALTNKSDMPLYNLSEINQNSIYIQDNDSFTWQLAL